MTICHIEGGIAMPTTLIDLFDEQVQTIPAALYSVQTNFGNRPANMFKEDGKWRLVTYNDLMNRVEKLAIALIKLGIERGEHIGIKANTSARWTWVDLGSMMAGAVTVSVYPNLSRWDTTAVVNHSQVRLLFVESKAKMQELSFYVSDMPSLQYIVCMEKGFRGNGKNTFGLGELITKGAEMYPTGLGLLRSRIKSISADSPATLVYTSGTVGNLKAALFSHKDILSTCTRTYRHLQMHGKPIDSNAVSLVMLPISHIYEKIHGYFCPLFVGGCLGFIASYENLMIDINTIRPTWITWVPRLASLLFIAYQKAFMGTKDGRIAWEKAIDVAVRTTRALEDANGYIDLTRPIIEQLDPALRAEWIESYNSVYWRVHHFLGGRVIGLIIAAAHLDVELHRKLVGMGLPIILGYGLSESAAAVALSCTDKYKIGWISGPVPGVEFEQDDDGELLLKGVGVISSFYLNEEATNECFTPDGWFRTGDIVEMNEEGFIRVVDRKKLLIVLDNGKNISQARLEALCGTSALIDQVAIVGQDREYISALIVPNFDFILRVLTSHGIPFDDSQCVFEEVDGVSTCVEVGEDIMSNDLVLVAMQDQIDMINNKLRDYEAIKRFRLLKRRFSEINGEVGPVNKLRMKVILERYADIIDELYK